MTSAVVLAAGLSKRMGKDKLSLPLGDKIMIEWVLDAVLASAIDDIVVILGATCPTLHQAIAKYGVKISYNPQYYTGQASSIKAGLMQLNPASQRCFFVMGDQPFIKSNIIDAMIASHQSQTIIRPFMELRKGAPVLFDRCFYDAFNQIKNDEGGKVVIANHQASTIDFDITCEHFFLDVDSTKEYNCAKKIVERFF